MVFLSIVIIIITIFQFFIVSNPSASFLIFLPVNFLLLLLSKFLEPEDPLPLDILLYRVVAFIWLILALYSLFVILFNPDLVIFGVFSFVIIIAFGDQYYRLSKKLEANKYVSANPEIHGLASV